MISLFALWMPILLSAVAVFILSSILHMVLRYHWSDLKPLPDEKGVMDALRGFDLPPGDYHFPHAEDMKEMGSPEFTEKLKQGPLAFMTVLPTGVSSMRNQLVMWFVFSIVVSIFAAYISRLTLPAGSEYQMVARVTGAVAFCGYGLALFQNSIWYKKNWCTTLKSVFDALLYGLFTGGIFGWLWPGA